MHAECIGLSCEVLAHRAVVVSSVAFEFHGFGVLVFWCFGVLVLCGRRVLWGSIMRDSLFQPKKNKKNRQKPEKIPLGVSLKYS